MCFGHHFVRTRDTSGLLTKTKTFASVPSLHECNMQIDHCKPCSFAILVNLLADWRAIAALVAGPQGGGTANIQVRAFIQNVRFIAQLLIRRLEDLSLECPMWSCLLRGRHSWSIPYTSKPLVGDVSCAASRVCIQRRIHISSRDDAV